MDRHIVKQKGIWLAGTLLVGALGSGLWEAALKPSLFWAGSLMLDIATLGMSSLRDGLYVDVAKGSYERASVMVMALLFGSISGVLLGIVISRIHRRNKSDEGEARTRAKRWLPLAVTIAYAMMLLIQCFRIMYIVRAANHLDQMERIVAPYVSKEEISLIDSRVARMVSRHEYITLTKELDAVARSKGIEPPTFNVY